MIIADMPERDYHARPELSSTQARQLLDSPARYKWALEHPQEPRAAFDVGTAAHTKILGVGAGIIAYPDEHLTASGSVSSKAATVLWAEDRRAEGLTPVSPDQLEAVDAMAEAVLAHPKARALLEQPGSPEVSVFATDPATGVDVRARFDYLGDTRPNGKRYAVDVKTTAGKADADGFAQSAAKYRYDVQQGHYLSTLDLATDGDAEMFFIVVEKAAPYLVAVHTLDEEFADMGLIDAVNARRILADCQRTGKFPGYTEEIGTVRPPMWLIYQHQDRYGGSDQIRI